MATAKRIITPEHFKVAPELLGLPLASPARRAFAMSVDLILVAILVKSGAVFLGIAAAVLLFRASARDKPGSFIRRSVRTALRATGAIILFVVIVNAWGFWRGSDDDDRNETPRVSVSIGNEEDDATEEDSTAVLVSADAAIRGYLAAVERSDTAQVRVLQDSIKQVVAGAQLASLDARARQLDRRADSLKHELDEARKAHGMRQFISGAADDLGVGFGWSAVYFTAFLALWRGQTPGKRMAGIRVLRLDGKPLGWWMSFERFGGYAASFSVGLLGFVQILWDRNRQGLHDKVTETVVVIDSNQARERA